MSRKGCRNKKFVELGIDAQSAEWKGYITQKGNAKRRDIPFLLTFKDWSLIWQASGKFHLRGRKRNQYVMARKGDIGAYEINNVEIVAHSANSSLPHKGRTRTPNTVQKISATHKKLHASITPEKREAWNEALKAGHRKKGGMKKLWQKPDYRNHMMKKRRETADSLTKEQRQTLSSLRKAEWARYTPKERAARIKAAQTGKAKV